MKRSIKIDLNDINYDCIFETDQQQSRKYNMLKDKYAKLQMNHISNTYIINNLQKQNKQLEKQLKELQDNQEVLERTIAQLLHRLMM